MVLTRTAVFWKRTFTACLISCLVALGATLRTYWLCFSARAVPFSVTRTDLTMRSGSRMGGLFLEPRGKLAQRAVGDENAVVTEQLLGVDHVARRGREPRMVPRGEINLLVRRLENQQRARLRVEPVLELGHQVAGLRLLE